MRENSPCSSGRVGGGQAPAAHLGILTHHALGEDLADHLDLNVFESAQTARKQKTETNADSYQRSAAGDRMSFGPHARRTEVASMSTLPFAHLHCHSHYSLLDGAGTIRGLLERAKALRMNALAITDHGNLHGALKFYQTAKELGINPILGLEAYIAPGSRFLKELGGTKEASHHLTLLARNAAGFRNLVRLSSAAFLEGFYFKPRIDKELLAAHKEGLICLSGCVSSELNRTLLAGGEANLERARQIAAWYRQVFGNDYYIEIQNNHLDSQRAAMEGAVGLARQMGIPLVATSDVHYINRDDAEAQDILLCVNTGKFRTDTNRMRMESNEFYLRSPEEMYAAFPGLDDALRLTQEIADSVHIELELGKRHFPVFTPPEEKTSEQYLRELCLAGLKDATPSARSLLGGLSRSLRAPRRSRGRQEWDCPLWRC